VVGFASYSITPLFNVVAQLGYVHAQTGGFKGTLSLDDLGPINGVVGTNGNVSSIANLYNFVVTPLGQDRPFTPYFGGGVGFASSRASLRSISVLGTAIPINVNSSDTDLAADLLIGSDYKIGPREHVGIVYQFVRISAGSLGSAGDLHAKTGPILSHFLGALFEYRF
jgi:opacity protein-like surface antigen